MNDLLKLLKKKSIAPEQVAKAVDMPFRSLAYNFQTGNIPYSLVYKIHVATGIPMDEIVPKHLAEEWLLLFNEKRKTNKPRGDKNINLRNKRTRWSKNLELNEPPAGQSPREKLHIPRETSVAVEPSVMLHSLPETKIPPKKTSIADLMKANPPAPPAQEPAQEPEPDFSQVPDSLFDTSMDSTNNPIRRKR